MCSFYIFDRAIVFSPRGSGIGMSKYSRSNSGPRRKIQTGITFDMVVALWDAFSMVVYEGPQFQELPTPG